MNRVETVPLSGNTLPRLASICEAFVAVFAAANASGTTLTVLGGDPFMGSRPSECGGEICKRADMGGFHRSDGLCKVHSGGPKPRGERAK